MFCLNFSSTLEDSSTPKGGSDIDIFSDRKWVLTVYTLTENLKCIIYLLKYGNIPLRNSYVVRGWLVENKIYYCPAATFIPTVMEVYEILRDVQQQITLSIILNL